MLISAACAVAALTHKFVRDKVPVALPEAGPPPQSRSEAVRRVLKHLERKPIREIREGEGAVIVGTVIALDGVDPIYAPCTSRMCIGFHLHMHANVYEGFSGFRQLHDEAYCVPFAVRDDSGEIIVDASGLELAITDSPPISVYPPHPRSVMTRIPAYSHLPVLVAEGLLVPGMRVLVCGVATTEALATDYRDGKTRLVLRASATFPLVASSDGDLFVGGYRPIAPQELHRR
jgi:hypothetical protein